MANDEQQKIESLCLSILHENNPARVIKLVAELNHSLEERDRRVAQSTATVSGVGQVSAP